MSKNTWIETKKEKPKMAKTLGKADETWWHSDYVIGRYKKHPKHGYGNQMPYELLRYETGKGWKQWYSPFYDDVAPEPDTWTHLPEEN